VDGYRPFQRILRLLLLVAVVACLSFAASGVPGILLTNTHQIAEGSISGLAPVIRLLATDGAVSIGPGPQFDIPLSSIRQITLDFPRVVIETADRVLIGPYSSFRGISQALQIDRPGESAITLPIASLRAIALNGHSLRPVPRVWLGDGYLSMPEISGASPWVDTECANCTISVPRTATDADLTPIWNGLSPEYVPEEPAELPWWVGLLGVAALVVVAYILTSAAGPAS